MPLQPCRNGALLATPCAEAASLTLSITGAGDNPKGASSQAGGGGCGSSTVAWVTYGCANLVSLFLSLQLKLP
jgi:hypothetical protein